MIAMASAVARKAPAFKLGQKQVFLYVGAMPIDRQKRILQESTKDA
jgi:hypothetical protein